MFIHKKKKRLPHQKRLHSNPVKIPFIPISVTVNISFMYLQHLHFMIFLILKCLRSTLKSATSDPVSLRHGLRGTWQKATNKGWEKSRATASCNVLREIVYTSNHDPPCFGRNFWMHLDERLDDGCACHPCGQPQE